MARYINVDVDTANAFAHKDGNLSVADDTVNDRIRGLVARALATNEPLIGCVDSHSYDAWEFIDNGGIFPTHAVKGTWDWLKLDGTLPPRFRFLPMSWGGDGCIGEDKAGNGPRVYGSTEFTTEALAGVGLYFEKEVYSAFSNPIAEAYIAHLVEEMGGKDNVIFRVFGYCLGGFCVDGFVTGLLERGYTVEVVTDACVALDVPPVSGDEGGMNFSLRTLGDAGATFVTADSVLGDKARATG